MKRIKLFMQNSTIHGLHYIIDSKRHWYERSFWAWICVVAVIGLTQLISRTWYNFNNNAISFTVETTYLDWETTFPAISICEHESSDKIFDWGNKMYGVNRNLNLDFYLRDITFFDGTCYACKVHCNKTIQCPNDMDYIVKQIRAPCAELIGACWWNDQPFNCCERFLPLDTEFGTCYTLNSIHKLESRDLFLLSNLKTGPGALKLKAYESIKLFLHSPENVPFFNHPHEEKEIITWGSLFNMTFQMREIKNDPLLHDITKEKRNCRFPEEYIPEIESFYSYSACIVNCRAKFQMTLCGCVHHFMSKKLQLKVCDFEGLICLTNNSEFLQLSSVNDYMPMDCQCLSSCDEPEYTVISKLSYLNERYEEEEFASEIYIKMESLPHERYKRNVVRTLLDLTVAIGSAAGLFLGVSLLNSFEIIYYLLIRRQDNHYSDKKPVIRHRLRRRNLIAVAEYTKNQQLEKLSKVNKRVSFIN